jgi:hypothetical protein
MLMKSRKKPLKPFNEFLNTPIESFGRIDDPLFEAYETSIYELEENEERSLQEIYEHYELHKVDNYSVEENESEIDTLLFRLILDFEYRIDWKDREALRRLLPSLLDKYVPAYNYRRLEMEKAVLIALVDYYTERRTSFNSACEYIKTRYGIKNIRNRYYKYIKNDSLLSMSNAIKSTGESMGNTDKENYYDSIVKYYFDKEPLR